MNPLYIFAMLSARGKAPHNKKTNQNQEYTFMPLHGETVYTIDADIWKIFKQKPSISFFPNNDESTLFFEKNLSSSKTILIGLTDEKKLEIPGSGLVELKPFKAPLNHEIIDMGYDVIDLFGLSAIANIGYSSDEVRMLLALNLDVTKYGLIESKEDAIKFTNFANSCAKEHAPFMPLKIKRVNLTTLK